MNFRSLYSGKKRLAKKFYGRRNSRMRELLAWALNVKPGDYIASCDGCNRQVASIEPVWVNEGRFKRGKPNKTKVLLEVIFTDTRGRPHYCPGGGCALPPETPEQVTAFVAENTSYLSQNIEKYYGKDPEKDPSYLRMRRIQEALAQGHEIVDGHGQLFPEFDTPIES